MDRLTQITMKTGHVGGITRDEMCEWHRLHVDGDAPAVATWYMGSEWVAWENVMSIRNDRPSYLDHQAADRYLDAQRKP